jgi:DNA-directed RNA polymerase specialized sigma24 family protein
MSTRDLPAGSELMLMSRKAAYCARRRLDGADLSTQDMEDLIQAATLAYWKHYREGRPVPFCFVCARRAAERYFYRKILGRNPRYPLSLDVLWLDGSDPSDGVSGYERLASSADDDGRTMRWLSDEVLEGVLFEARQAAGYSKRSLSRCQCTLQTDKHIIRLAANGHTNASIAELLGTTEGTIRNRRQRIRRLLEGLLPPNVQVEYNRSGGDQQRAREIQSAYRDCRKPAPAR